MYLHQIQEGRLDHAQKTPKTTKTTTFETTMGNDSRINVFQYYY